MDKLNINKNICAIIPARGNSKGIKDKNLQLIGQDTLISRTINIAKSSKYIQKVFVSTDSEKIAEISKSLKSEVIKRPSEISDDHSSSESALIHALNEMKMNEYHPGLTVFLQCTSPFTTINDIDGAIEKLCSGYYDSVFTATSFHHFIWGKNNNTAIGVNHDHKKNRIRRQELAEQWLETGSVYVFKTDQFLKQKNRFFGKIGVYQVNQINALQIDTPEDMDLVRKIYSE